PPRYRHAFPTRRSSDLDHGVLQPRPGSCNLRFIHLHGGAQLLETGCRDRLRTRQRFAPVVDTAAFAQCRFSDRQARADLAVLEFDQKVALTYELTFGEGDVVDG